MNVRAETSKQAALGIARKLYGNRILGVSIDGNPRNRPITVYLCDMPEFSAVYRPVFPIPKAQPKPAPVKKARPKAYKKSKAQIAAELMKEFGLA